MIQFLSMLLIIGIIIFSVVYLVQVIVAFILVSEGYFQTKKEFLYFFIPLFWAKEIIIESKDEIKKFVTKIKELK